MESLTGISTMRGRVAQRADDIAELKHRSRPAMRHEER